MCSIFCILNLSQEHSGFRDLAVRQSNLMKHRGPDWSGVWNNPNAILAHQRLAIVGVESGSQPLTDKEQNLVLCANGEIYNHHLLWDSLASCPNPQTRSDCEVILPLYREYGPGLLGQLKGMFAFVLFDAQKNQFLIARDPIGIVPLYFGKNRDGQLFVSSEMKALIDCCETIEEFPPGHYMTQKQDRPKRYFKEPWFDYQNVRNNPKPDPKAVQSALEQSVKSHLMTDVPYGVLLSGGLDSSIISSIAQTFSKKRIETGGTTKAWWPQIHSFSIGLEGSPDLLNAEKVAQAIGTIHHSFHYTIQDGIDALPAVISSIESYDVTTVRASIPMWLLA